MRIRGHLVMEEPIRGCGACMHVQHAIQNANHDWSLLTPWFVQAAAVDELKPWTPLTAARAQLQEQKPEILKIMDRTTANCQVAKSNRKFRLDSFGASDSKRAAIVRAGHSVHNLASVSRWPAGFWLQNEDWRLPPAQPARRRGRLQRPSLQHPS